MASSGQSPFQGERLQIDDLKSLSDIIRSLGSDSSLAKQITMIEIDEKEVDESELDPEGDPPEIDPKTYEQFGMNLSKIIQEVQQQGGIESFKWTGVDQKNVRPDVFWESLWKTNATLKTLNIEFSVHELEALSKLVSHPPQSPVHTNARTSDPPFR